MAEGQVDDPLQAEVKPEITFACILCGRDGLVEEEMKFHIMVEHIEEHVCCPFCDQNCGSTEKLNRHVNDEHMEMMNSMNKEEDVVESHVDVGSDQLQPDKPDVIFSYVNNSECTEHENPADACVDLQNKKNYEAGSGSSQLGTNRSKLYLDMPKLFSGACGHQSADDGAGAGSVVGPAPGVTAESPDATFHCPLCSFSTGSEVAIQQHVNRDHKDVLSPMKGHVQDKPMEEDGYEMLYSCPICGMSTDTPRNLELHINTNHVDILSPGNEKKSDPLGAQCSGGSENGDLLYCPVCDQEFGDPVSLSSHVDGHFSAEHTPVSEVTDALLAKELQRCEAASASQEKRDFQMLQAMYGMDEKASYKQQYEKSLEKAVWKGDLTISEFYQQKTRLQANDLIGVDDGHSCTKGIIHQIQYFHRKCAGFVQQAWTCSTVDHYSGSYGDKGWGCGYRNLQMLLSSLASDPNFCKIIFNGRPLIPSIPKIQRLIEVAWEKGFDKQGSEQLGGRVVNTRKWIGATEIVATLSALRIKCQLVDFHSPSSLDGTHPRLFQWVKDYFSRPGAFKPPLYLQHQGHSRTIIGYEEMKDRTGRLLIFDPSTPRKQMIQFTGVINGTMMRTLRRNLNGLRAKQYQLVSVIGVLNDKEYEESKVMKSERIS